MINLPWNGRGFAHAIHFLCTTVELEKNLHGIQWTAINNVGLADDGLLLIADILVS